MRVESLPSLPVFDRDGAMERLGGDRGLFLELAEIVLDDMPILFQDVQRAARDSDAPRVRSKAHALKGLAAACGGSRAAAVAQSLENAGQAGNLDEVGPLLESLEEELSLLTQTLRAERGE